MAKYVPDPRNTAVKGLVHRKGMAEGWGHMMNKQTDHLEVSDSAKATSHIAEILICPS